MTKDLLLSIVTELESSTNTSWRSGNLDDVYTWAKKMKDTILTVVPQLRIVAEDSESKDKLSIEEVAKLIKLLNE